MRQLLFLDDMEVRHKRVTEIMEEYQITHVYNAKEAIEKLSTERFDVVSLDHDLSIESIMTEPEKGEGSGYDVAIYISNMPEEIRPPIVVLHTLNPVGARRMWTVLDGKVERLTIMPFIS